MANQSDQENWSNVNPRRLLGLLAKVFAVIGMLLLAVFTIFMIPNAALFWMFTLAFASQEEALTMIFFFLLITTLLLAVVYFIVKKQPKRERIIWLCVSFFPALVLGTFLSFPIASLFMQL